jgi:hypothetical protein
MMKYNKNLPMYYRVSIEGKTEIKATMTGVNRFMEDNNTKKCFIETVQKVNGEFIQITGKKSGILNGELTSHN